MKRKTYNEVEENQVFIGRSGDIARTSKLLECAGLLIYDSSLKCGVLAHWQNEEAESKLEESLLEANLNNPQAIIIGCGLPIECLSLEDSISYGQVRSFLEERRIPIHREKVGMDRAVKLKVDFTTGNYSMRYT